MEEQLLPVGEACRRLKIHPNTLRKWDREGKIRTVRTQGGKRRIPVSEVERLVREMGTFEGSVETETPVPEPTPRRILTPPEAKILKTPLLAGLIMIGTAIALTFPLIFLQSSFRIETFFSVYVVFILASSAGLWLIGRGISGEMVAEPGRKVLAILITCLSIMCAGGFFELYRSGIGVDSLIFWFKIVLIGSILLLVGFFVSLESHSRKFPSV